MDTDKLMCEVVSQREALEADMESFRCGLYQKCRSILCASSADGEIAADSRPETAGSSKSGASCSAGRCDGTTASAGAVSSSVEDMPGKAQIPQPTTFGGGAFQMPSHCQLLSHGRMGHAVSGAGAVAATTLMPEAIAKTQDKATQAADREAALNQGSEQSSPEMAAQGAKQARKQAKRARQRARRAQGAAVGPDSKVCSSL